MNIVSSAGIFVALAGICLDRLLKQRSALKKPDFPFAGTTFEIVPQKAKRIRDPEVFGVIDPETGRRSSVELSDLPAFSSAY
jgi:hypothetical protein